MAKDYSKFAAELYRDLLLFFAVVFFTCVVGVIELLPELEKINGLFSWSWLALTVLYFGLVVGIEYSMDRCFWLYRRNKDVGKKSGYGFVYPELEGWVQRVFRKIVYLEGVLIVGITIEFIILYLVKIGMLH
jgi:hypothetical protein